MNCTERAPDENFVVEIGHDEEHLLPPRRPSDPPQIVIVLGPEHVEPPIAELLFEHTTPKGSQQ